MLLVPLKVPTVQPHVLTVPLGVIRRTRVCAAVPTSTIHALPYRSGARTFGDTKVATVPAPSWLPIVVFPAAVETKAVLLT